MEAENVSFVPFVSNPSSTLSSQWLKHGLKPTVGIQSLQTQPTLRRQNRGLARLSAASVERERLILNWSFVGVFSVALLPIVFAQSGSPGGHYKLSAALSQLEGTPQPSHLLSDCIKKWKNKVRMYVENEKLINQTLGWTDDHGHLCIICCYLFITQQGCCSSYREPVSM